MKKTVLNKNERLLAYSAMAAAMVAAIPDANADILTSDNLLGLLNDVE